jgi:hypothetical protein
MIDYLSKDTKAGKVTSLITAIGIGAYALGVGGCVATKCVDKKPKQETKYVAHVDRDELNDIIKYLHNQEFKSSARKDNFLTTLGDIAKDGYIPSKEGNEIINSIVTYLFPKQDVPSDYLKVLDKIANEGYPAEGKMLELKYAEAESDSIKTTPKVLEKERLSKTSSKQSKLEKTVAQTNTPSIAEKDSTDYDTTLEEYEPSIETTQSEEYTTQPDSLKTDSVTVETTVQIPNLAETKTDEQRVELVKNPTEESTHWYDFLNEGIFARKDVRVIGGLLAGAGMTYVISELTDDDNGKGPIGPEPGVTGGRGDSISDAGTVRGGRGDKSGSDSGGNR